MAAIQFTYNLFKDDEPVFQSTAEVKLTKKQLKETEDFIIAHNYSACFVDVPSAVYDKCFNSAYEKAISDCPGYSSRYEELFLELEEYIPVSLIRLLSDDVKRKMLSDDPYYMDEAEIFPAAAPSECVGDESLDTSAPVADTPSGDSAPLDDDMNAPQEDCHSVVNDAAGEEEVPTKENTLYLPIKQVYFDQIVEGKKKKEYREIKYTTYKKYLECNEYGEPYFDETLIDTDHPLCGDIYVWNNGVYPYFDRSDCLYLHLVVGYNKKRDEAIVEIEDITFEPALDKLGSICRFNITEEGKADRCEDGKYCIWNAVFHLGRVVELHRAK